MSTALRPDQQRSGSDVAIRELAATSPPRTGGPRLKGWHVLLGVLGLVVLVALGLAVGLQLSGDPVHRAAAPGQPADAGMARLLNQHGQALRSRDAAAWQADLDSSPAASDYRTAQRSLFANLAQVPLSAWSYTAVGEVTDPAARGAAARRLGGAVRILHVRLSYALARVDPEPTTRDLWLTAVSRDGSWKLAGDSDALDLNDHSWRGLWDFGPVAVTRTAHALVLAHPDRPDHAAQARLDAAAIERAVPLVNGAWGAAWNSQVAVLVPDTAAEFAAVTGDGADLSQLAALSIADEVERAATHRAGLVLGARIVVNPVNLQRLSAPARQLVLQHELTHVAARAVTDDAMPLWLSEGFADYVGNLGSGRTSAQSAPDLAADLRSGHGPAALPTSASFGGSNPGLSQVYEQSALACSMIAHRVGAPGLARFYRAVSAAARVDPDTATAVALRAVLHTDVATFTRDWRAYLQEQLR